MIEEFEMTAGIAANFIFVITYGREFSKTWKPELVRGFSLNKLRRPKNLMERK